MARLWESEKHGMGGNGEWSQLVPFSPILLPFLKNVFLATSHNSPLSPIPPHFRPFPRHFSIFPIVPSPCDPSATSAVASTGCVPSPPDCLTPPPGLGPTGCCRPQGQGRVTSAPPPTLCRPPLSSRRRGLGHRRSITHWLGWAPTGGVQGALEGVGVEGHSPPPPPCQGNGSCQSAPSPWALPPFIGTGAGARTAASPADVSGVPQAPQPHGAGRRRGRGWPSGVSAFAWRCQGDYHREAFPGMAALEGGGGWPWSGGQRREMTYGSFMS